MIKLVFVLVIFYNGTVNTSLEFMTKDECQATEKQLRTVVGGARYACVEKRKKKAKMNCKIENKIEYFNRASNVMQGPPYPVAFSCVEEY